MQEERRGADFYLFDLDHFVIMVRARHVGLTLTLYTKAHLPRLLGVLPTSQDPTRQTCCHPAPPASQHADCSVKERVRQALPGLPFEAREDSDHLVIDAHKIGG